MAKQNKIIYVLEGMALAVAIVSISAIITSPSFAFTGPTCTTGNCSGAIAADNANNVGISTSTPSPQTRLTIVASTTGLAGYFPFKILQPNLSPLLIVQDDGKVGVGTIAPSEKLSVVGNITLTGSVLGGSISAGNVSAAQFGLNTGGGTYSVPGNFGAGTAAPGYRVDAQGGDINTSGVYRQGGTNAGLASTVCPAGQALTGSTVKGGIVTAGVCTAVGSGAGTITTSTVPTTNYLTKFSGVNTIANTIIFDNATNVGISTAAPGYKLDVQTGDINTSGVYRKGGTAGLTAVCATGQVLATTTVSGGIITGGTCVALGGGTVTSVAAGTGLAAAPSPIVGAGTLSLNINGGTTQTCGASNHVSSITAAGIVTCTADVGPSTMSSNNISAGQFGLNTGGGNYWFPANLGVATSDTAYTLSVTGTGKFTGDVTLGDGVGTDLTVGNGTGKINAGTIDPIYMIGGKHYATYVSGMVGQKEEVTGVLHVACPLSVVSLSNPSPITCTHEIDFNALDEGSDLWLFGKTTNIKNHFDGLAVILTPAFNGKVWYEKDPINMKLIVHASPLSPITSNLSPSLEVSYRLTAPRFDAGKWPTMLPHDAGESAGFVIEE